MEKKIGNKKDNETVDIPSGVGKVMYEQLRKRINYLFKDVLDEVDSTKNKVINFTDGNKEESFKRIRKKLLDRGNDVLDMLELFFKEVEIVGVKSIVKLSPKLIEELKKDDKKEE